MLRCPFRLATLLGLLLFLPGCTHLLSINRAPTYIVQAPMIPTLTQARTADAELMVAATGFGARAAVAPVRGLALTASGRHYRADRSADRFRSGELGLAFSRPLPSRVVVGVGAGFGAGSGKSRGHRYETWYNYSFFSMSGSSGTTTEYDSLRRQVTSRYATVYLMPFFTYQVLADKMELAGAIRLNWVRYRELLVAEDHWVDRRTNFSAANYRVSTLFDGARRQRLQYQVMYLLAGALTPRLWLTWQSSVELGLNPPSRRYDFGPMSLVVGLRYRIGKR